MRYFRDSARIGLVFAICFLLIAVSTVMPDMGYANEETANKVDISTFRLDRTDSSSMYFSYDINGIPEDVEYFLI